EHFEAAGGHGGAVAQVAVGAPVEVRECDGRAAGFEHAHRFGDHFFADTVAGRDGDALLRHAQQRSRRTYNQEFRMSQTTLQERWASAGARMGEYGGIATPASFDDV